MTGRNLSAVRFLMTNFRVIILTRGFVCFATQRLHKHVKKALCNCSSCLILSFQTAFGEHSVTDDFIFFCKTLTKWQSIFISSFLVSLSLFLYFDKPVLCFLCPLAKYVSFSLCVRLQHL